MKNRNSDGGRDLITNRKDRLGVALRYLVSAYIAVRHPGPRHGTSHKWAVSNRFADNSGQRI
jgi:hypothetical protein